MRLAALVLFLGICSSCAHQEIFEAKGINDTFEAHRSEFIECYKHAVTKTRQEFHLIQTVDAKIERSGKVQSVDVTKTETEDATVEQQEIIGHCVIDVMNGIQFPEYKHPGWIELHKRLIFGPTKM